MLPSVGDNCYRKFIFSAMGYGQADTIKGDRPLWHGCEILAFGVSYGDEVATILVFNGFDVSYLVYMPLYDMSV